MYKLTRMHLDSVGSSSARFAGLTLDFTDDDHDPLDTIVWLRNGGGKTTLLALMFSLFLPYRRDFLGYKEDRKTLGDYVLSGDTAHVLCEWDTPSGSLVTGAVYEWPERRRPVEHEKHAGDLATRFYVFNPKKDVLSFDRRPDRDVAGRRRHLDAYVRELRALGKAHPLTNLVVVNTGTDWSAALLDRGIDPAVFKYQKEMNKGEGAIDEQFRFASGDNFVSFLIEMVVDSEASDSVSERMGTLASKLAAKPRTQRELGYCEGVAERLGPIAALFEDRGRRASALSDATRLAAEMSSRLDAAREVAVDAEASANRTREEAAQRRLDAETARTTARDRGREYGRRAASFWVQDAAERISSITAAQSETAAEAAGWDALEHVLELESAQAQIRDIDRQLSAKAADSEPLRLERNAAARRLHWRYADQLSTARGEHEALDQRSREFDASAEAHDTEAGSARQAVGRLEETISSSRSELRALEDAIVGAVAAGHLERGGDPARTVRDARTAAGDTDAALERLANDVDRRSQRQREILASQREVSASELSATALLDAARTTWGRLGDEASALATHERVRELTQSDQVSIWGAHQMLDARLSEEIARADGALVSEEVAAERDRRNRNALGDGGLLPPSRDADAMLRVLSAAGISAVPGLAYLSASVARRNWEAAIEAHPGLLSGILVDAGDFERARAALIEAEEHPASLVTLASKSALEAEGESAFVVPPSAALFDTAAADAERSALDERLDDLDGRKTLIEAGREADRVLRERLRVFIESCPAGHLDVLEREIEGHEKALEELAERLSAFEAEDAAITKFLSEAADERDALIDSRVALATRVQVLTSLAERWAVGVELEARVEVATEGLTAARARADAQSRAAAEDRDALKDVRGKISALGTRISNLQSALSLVVLRGDGEWGEFSADGPAAATATEELERDLASREEEYSGAVSDPVLEERRRRADQDRSKAQDLLNGQGAEAIERAGELRATPASSDALSRATRAGELRDRADALLVERGLADGDLVLAERRKLETTPSDRHVHRELTEDELPADRTDAEARQAIEEAEAQRQQLAVTRANEEGNAALEAARAAKARVEMFEVLVATLSDLVGPEFADELGGVTLDTVVFTGSDDEAKAAHAQFSKTLREAREAYDKIEVRLSRSVGELRSFATNADLAEAGVLREPVLMGEVTDVARRAGELAEAHQTRAAVLRSDLSSIAQDQAILVTDLSGQVHGVLDLLKRAPHISVMDQSLGEWANKSFLTITFDDVSAQPDELARRVSEEIDVIVAKGDVPEGLVTLQRVVRSAVPGGFRVRVLKPTADLHEERVPVSAMSKWSGGEKLTAAVVLYCIVARLRARNRSRQLPMNSSGALVLDNPLGKSNYVGFLAVQRRVAGALGVQLVYTTGVRDLKAVGTFPNVIRCRNRRSASQERGYVVATERGGEAHGTTLESMGMLSTARVVRLDPSATPVPGEGPVPTPAMSEGSDGAA